MAPSPLVRDLVRRGGEMTEALEALVSVESPSSDVRAVARCADEAARIGASLLGAEPERLERLGRPLLRWSWGPPTRVLVLCHIDTVWPLGTIDEWPFSISEGRATGPGAFDMKAGLVQGLFGLAALQERDGVTLLVTPDEEIGSPSSAEVIESEARGARAALVLEPSADGALKTARKGISVYRIRVTGRAAHAGLDPEKGVNALTELAHQVLAIPGLADAAAGTTVVPGLASAGTAVNTVPARAELQVDVRCVTPEEQERIDLAMRALRPVIDGARLDVELRLSAPPMPPSASADLFARAGRVAATLGLPALEGRSVGGGSDGNLTAGLGTPTLDGLGAVGDGAHARGEHVEVEAMPARAALLAGLVADLLDG